MIIEKKELEYILLNLGQNGIDANFKDKVEETINESEWLNN